MRRHLRFTEKKKLQKNYTRHIKSAALSCIKHEGGLPGFPSSRLIAQGPCRCRGRASRPEEPVLPAALPTAAGARLRSRLACAFG